MGDHGPSVPIRPRPSRRVSGAPARASQRGHSPRESNRPRVPRTPPPWTIVARWCVPRGSGFAPRRVTARCRRAAAPRLLPMQENATREVAGWWVGRFLASCASLDARCVGTPGVAAAAAARSCLLRKQPLRRRRSLPSRASVAPVPARDKNPSREEERPPSGRRRSGALRARERQAVSGRRREGCRRRRSCGSSSRSRTPRRRSGC